VGARTRASASRLQPETTTGGWAYDLVVNRAVHWVWFPFRVTVRFIMQNGKRIAVSVAGGLLVLAGLVFLVLPGPGVVLILAGLAILATEYVWAQRALNFARDKAKQARDKVRRTPG
jgi:uncharacterized protein (TIGR02611 family)